MLPCCPLLYVFPASTSSPIETPLQASTPRSPPTPVETPLQFVKKQLSARGINVKTYQQVLDLLNVHPSSLGSDVQRAYTFLFQRFPTFQTYRGTSPHQPLAPLNFLAFAVSLGLPLYFTRLGSDVEIVYYRQPQAPSSPAAPPRSPPALRRLRPLGIEDVSLKLGEQPGTSSTSRFSRLGFPKRHIAEEEEDIELVEEEGPRTELGQREAEYKIVWRRAPQADESPLCTKDQYGYTPNFMSKGAVQRLGVPMLSRFDRGRRSGIEQSLSDQEGCDEGDLMWVAEGKNPKDWQYCCYQHPHIPFLTPSIVEINQMFPSERQLTNPALLKSPALMNKILTQTEMQHLLTVLYAENSVSKRRALLKQIEELVSKTQRSMAESDEMEYAREELSSRPPEIDPLSWMQENDFDASLEEALEGVPAEEHQKRQQIANNTIAGVLFDWGVRNIGVRKITSGVSAPPVIPELKPSLAEWHLEWQPAEIQESLRLLWTPILEPLRKFRNIHTPQREGFRGDPSYVYSDY